MAPRKNPHLDRRQVAQTALLLLNEVGLEGLTLRAIAARLDVQAPALYWHFKDKQALLDEMATEMVRRMATELTDPEMDDWRETVGTRMRALREHLLRYRDGAKVYSGTRFTDTSYAHAMQANLQMLTQVGFTASAAARAWFTAYAYTIGYVIEEQAMHPRPRQATVAPDSVVTGAGASAENGEFDLDARAERLADYPLAAQAGPELFRNYDDGFETGLHAVLAGIDATLRG